MADDGMNPSGASPGDRAVLFFITGLHLGGGAEAQLMRLAGHLRHRGWRVEIVSAMPVSDHLASLLIPEGVSVSSLGIPRGRYDLRALPRLVRVIRRVRPGIVCTFLVHANILGRVAAWLAGVPVVVSSIRNVNFGGAWAERALRWTDRLCDMTTTNSEIAAASLERRRITRSGRLRVVPNGLDVGRIRRIEPDRAWIVNEVGCADDAFVWLAVGRLEPQKAYGVTLEALARLAGEGRRVHLAVVGEGTRRGELARAAERLGVARHVTFLGARSDVPRLMRSADGFVLSSEWEGLPNVIMEAQAAGVPVVATSVGGTPELVDHGVSGMLVPPRDAVALGDAMAATMDLSEDARARMTSAARRSIESAYATETVMPAWEGLFAELMRDRQHRSSPRLLGIRRGS